MSRIPLCVCLALGALLATLGLYGSSRFPYSDDWSFVPRIVSGDLSIGWIFLPHNEHSIPLVKLIHFVTLRATDFYYPAITVINVALITAATLLVLNAVTRWRGTPDTRDVLIPVLMMSPSLPIARWSFSTHFCLIVLGCALVVTSRFIDQPDRVRTRDLVLLIAGFLTLSTAGLQGLTYAGVFAIVLLVKRFRWALLAGITASIAAGIAPLVIQGSDGGIHESASATEVIPAFVHLLTNALNPIFVGLPWLAGVVLLVTASYVTRVASHNRDRTAYATVVGATTILALTIAIARSGTGWSSGITLGYALLMLPGGVALAASWLMSNARVARLGVRVALVVGVVSVVAGTVASIENGTDNRRETRTVQTEIDAGVSSEQIVRDHIDFFYFDNSERRIAEITPKLNEFRSKSTPE